MGWVRVDTVHVFPELRQALTALLRELEPSEWESPTVCGAWNVRDVAAHLLGVELGNVARRRDGALVGPDPGDELGPWLAGVNEEWVIAARRLSARVIADLLDVSGAWFEDHVRSLELDALGSPVSWASVDPTPVWLDVAREFTERWIHQQQIREAVGRPGLAEAKYLRPVNGTFVHALPMALAGSTAPEGTAVEFRTVGEAGDVWHLVPDGETWDLRVGGHPHPSTTVSMPAAEAWRLFARHPEPPDPEIQGDRAFAQALTTAVGIIV